VEAQAQGAPPPAHRPPPPRKEKTIPKLSKEALQGATPLRSFAELKALFEAKKPGKEAETPPAAPAEKPAPETPPPAEAAAPAEQNTPANS
jgi:hypothetical protein